MPRIFIFLCGLATMLSLPDRARSSSADHGAVAAPAPAEELPKVDCSRELSEGESQLLNALVEELKKISGLDAGSAQTAQRARKLVDEAWPGLSAGAKAKFVQEQFNQAMGSASTKELRMAVAHYRADSSTHIGTFGPAGIYPTLGTLDILNGADEAWAASSNEVTKSWNGLSNAIQKSTIPATQKKLLISQLSGHYKMLLNRDVKMTSDSVERLKSEETSFYMVLAGAALTAPVAAAAAITVQVGAVATGAIVGATGAAGATLLGGQGKMLAEAMLSGKDVGCEFAQKAAVENPGLAKQALVNGLVGAVTGGGIGGVLAKAARMGRGAVLVAGGALRLAGGGLAVNQGWHAKASLHEARLHAGNADQLRARAQVAGSLEERVRLEKEADSEDERARSAAVDTVQSGVGAVSGAAGAAGLAERIFKPRLASPAPPKRAPLGTPAPAREVGQMDPPNESAGAGHESSTSRQKVEVAERDFTSMRPKESEAKKTANREARDRHWAQVAERDKKNAAEFTSSARSADYELPKFRDGEISYLNPEFIEWHRQNVERVLKAPLPQDVDDATRSVDDLFRGQAASRAAFAKDNEAKDPLFGRMGAPSESFGKLRENALTMDTLAKFENGQISGATAAQRDFRKTLADRVLKRFGKITGKNKMAPHEALDENGVAVATNLFMLDGTSANGTLKSMTPIEDNKKLFDSVKRCAAKAITASSLKDRTEYFARSAFLFFQVMPYERGSAAIGRSFYEGLGRRLFGPGFKLSADVDVEAMTRVFRASASEPDGFLELIAGGIPK